MNINMDIEYYIEDCQFELSNKYEITKWINETITYQEREIGDVSIIFCSDNYLLEVNKKYLNHDYYTDIITFDYCEKELNNCPISGDLFISIDTVNRNAKEYKIEFEIELRRVIIHGILHLLGYKDKSETEAMEMRSQEDFYLNRFETTL